MLRGLLLLPSAMKARNNPDAQTLSDVIPAPLYARWLRVKQRYLGRSLGIEKRRPIVAAEQLDQAALRDEGLVRDNRIEKTVRRAAKRNGVEIVSPTIEILVTDPAELLKELRVTSLDDVACLERTIARVESDLETLKLRANAWALGEVELLQRLPYTDNYRACTDALLESRLAPRAGLDDLQARVAEVWLKAVDSALTEHEQSFAMLPIGVLLREDGYLARLTERGYRVQAPQ